MEKPTKKPTAIWPWAWQDHMAWHGLLVQPEVTLGAPPDAVDMVGGVAGGVVLFVDELNDECRPLDAIRVLLALFDSAVESEMDLVDPGVFHALQLLGPYVGGHAVGVRVQQLGE